MKAKIPSSFRILRMANERFKSTFKKEDHQSVFKVISENRRTNDLTNWNVKDKLRKDIYDKKY